MFIIYRIEIAVVIKKCNKNIVMSAKPPKIQLHKYIHSVCKALHLSCSIEKTKLC